MSVDLSKAFAVEIAKVARAQEVEIATLRAEVVRLREALREASDVCAQEYTVDNQRSMDRVMRVISLALHPTALADDGGGK